MLLDFLKFRAWVTVHEIYYKNNFLKMFQSCLEASLSYWKEVTGQYWDNILVEWHGFWSICYKHWWLVGTFEWILFNFWSCLQFVLLARCWKFSWSVIMEYSLFIDIRRSKSWMSWVFLFRMRIQKEGI